MSFVHYNGVPNSSASASGNSGHYLGETFFCMWDHIQGLHCNHFFYGYNLNTHLRDVHGIHGPDKYRVLCKWNGCGLEVNKESLGRHVEEKHMRIIHSCECGKTFSRRDTLSRHRTTCPHHN
ncbi:hypothetical protein DEU56DRAFT_142975 [Suillus clintonianus]|uniref:uncharacterized protein n=1 Tax=Suillus clintonianus TaxID=1904413 RepID=UPI001B87553F|nr:uncharacterized protein DEU56DRAFT_142975 [Suillus clintonianus]KAG2118389.1 hypothetical protein DEU56DRAFT_142975 [Suillus clintonianus]